MPIQRASSAFFMREARNSVYDSAFAGGCPPAHFYQTVREARKAFAEVSPDELRKMIDEAVEDVRAKPYRERARRS
jgi:hypothetical protein